jgi:hypothetical protein
MIGDRRDPIRNGLRREFCELGLLGRARRSVRDMNTTTYISVGTTHAASRVGLAAGITVDIRCANINL